MSAPVAPLGPEYDRSGPLAALRNALLVITGAVQFWRLLAISAFLGFVPAPGENHLS